MHAHEARPGPCVITRVDIARIHPYGHNPRRQPNLEYLRIKDSIRAEGLDQLHDDAEWDIQLLRTALETDGRLEAVPRETLVRYPEIFDRPGEAPVVSNSKK